MKIKLLVVLCLFASKFLIGQTINRVEVHGFLYANANDIEAVAIYNKSSNKGTITNEKGEFLLEVTENDIIEISALQFEKQTITVTKEVVDSKSFRVYLVEQVNQLNAVVLRHGLSGNLVVDISQVEIAPIIELNIGNMDAIALDDLSLNYNRTSRALNEVMNTHELQHGVDFVKLGKMLFKTKKRASIDKNPKFERPVFLLDVYSREFVSKTFNIPLEQIENFIAFAEDNGLTEELLKGPDEFKRIDFLIKQSELFLIRQGSKE